VCDESLLGVHVKSLTLPRAYVVKLESGHKSRSKEVLAINMLRIAAVKALSRSLTHIEHAGFLTSADIICALANSTSGTGVKHVVNCLQNATTSSTPCFHHLLDYPLEVIRTCHVHSAGMPSGRLFSCFALHFAQW
jgi:hypothetical protein